MHPRIPSVFWDGNTPGGRGRLSNAVGQNRGRGRDWQSRYNSFSWDRQAGQNRGGRGKRPSDNHTNASRGRGSRSFQNSGRGGFGESSNSRQRYVASRNPGASRFGNEESSDEYAGAVGRLPTTYQNTSKNCGTESPS